MSDKDITIQFVPKPIHPKFKDVTGKVFNYLTVIGYAGKTPNNKNSVWWCRCECKNITKSTFEKLRNNSKKSCGCKKNLGDNHKKHGEFTNGKQSLTYQSYMAAKSRCEYKKNIGYERYGGRGIKFLFQSVTDLIDEIGHRPSEQHSLERINNDGYYEKGNVKWATDLEQGRNRRNNTILTVNGETKCMSEWAETVGIKTDTISHRLRYGWCSECAIFKNSCNHRSKPT